MSFGNIWLIQMSVRPSFFRGLNGVDWIIGPTRRAGRFVALYRSAVARDE
jgi:hypothetical protein